MNWYKFKLKSGNFVIVLAKLKEDAKKKFSSVWSDPVKIIEEGDDEMPDGAVEVLTA